MTTPCVEIAQASRKNVKRLSPHLPFRCVATPGDGATIARMAIVAILHCGLNDKSDQRPNGVLPSHFPILVCLYWSWRRSDLRTRTMN
jgi:hypothetical protein